METTNKSNLLKGFLYGIILCASVTFALRGCEPKVEMAEQVQLIENNKLKAELKKNDKEFEDYEKKLILHELKEDSLIAVAELSKKELKKIQNLKQKPAPIESITDCNNAVQEVYNWSLEKDSVCNVTVQNLDKVIFSKDSTNDILTNEKKVLLSSLLKKDNLFNNSEKANMNLEKDKNDLTKSVKTESTKKNFWKTTAAAAGLEIIRRIIFK